jgi:hypothetical protein
MAAAAAYYSHNFVDVKREVEEIESRVREKWGMTSSAKVDEEILPWVPETGFCPSREAKYLKLWICTGI